MIFNIGKNKGGVQTEQEPSRTVEAQTIERWRIASQKSDGAVGEPAASRAIPLSRVSDLSDVEDAPVRPAWTVNVLPPGSAKTGGAQGGGNFTTPVAAFSQQQFSGASKSSQFASTFGNAALKQHFAPVESGVAPIPVEQVVTLTPPPAPVRLSVEDELKSRFGTNVRSALGPGTVIEGKFSFDTPVRIDGTLKGEVVATSVLIVGEEGVVDASVQVGSLVVLGRVVGDVVAEDLVEIKSTGTLDGDISSERLMVEDGGVFRGRCNV